MNLECTALCKYSLIGCPRRKCGFAHEPSQLKPRMCPHGAKCRFDRRNKNLRVNARPCGMFHPGEEVTAEEVYKRAVEFSKPTDKDDVFRCTRFCRFAKTHCPKRKSGECTHAHTDEEVRPLVCPYESYCIGAACRFPFHGEAVDREKMLAYARDVQYDELPEALANVMVVRPWDEDAEEPDMSAEPAYNVVTMTQVSRELKEAKEAKEEARAASARAVEAAKEEARAVDAAKEEARAASARAVEAAKEEARAVDAAKEEARAASARAVEAAKEESKEEDMDLTPEAPDEYGRAEALWEATEKKKLAMIVMENFELFKKHAKWVTAMIQ